MKSHYSLYLAKRVFGFPNLKIFENWEMRYNTSKDEK